MLAAGHGSICFTSPSKHARAGWRGAGQRLNVLCDPFPEATPDRDHRPPGPPRQPACSWPRPALPTGPWFRRRSGRSRGLAWCPCGPSFWSERPPGASLAPQNSLKIGSFKAANSPFWHTHSRRYKALSNNKKTSKNCPVRRLLFMFPYAFGFRVLVKFLGVGV